MLKKISTVLALLLALAVTSQAQWQYSGVFPAGEDTLKGSTHGLAVDGEGKIWVSNYYADNRIVNTNGDTVNVASIHVFNADGSEAAFSPLSVIDFGATSDTLYGNTRGLGVDAEGNILYTKSGPSAIFKIDYMTGAGLAKAALDYSPTAATSDETGLIYVGPVVPENPIQVYDQDLNFLQNAVESTPAGGFSRDFAVSGDGNTIYFAGYPLGKVYVYNRVDEFSPYEIVDSVLTGFHAESFDWNPKNNVLWVSAGSYNDMPTDGYTPGTWYGYDAVNDVIIDSLTWDFDQDIDLTAQRPRAIDFSLGGDTAYVGAFGTNSIPMAQMFVRNTDPVDVTFQVNMAVQVADNQFDPATGTVTLAGSFNEWSTSATPMTDTDGDNIYSVTVTGLEPGERVAFKFVKNGDGWESLDDRTYVVRGENSTFTAYWENDLGGGISVDLAFEVNMELEKVSGRFNSETDTVSVRGSFNGWTGTGEDAVMSPSPTNANVYTLVTSDKVLAGDVIAYKFAYVTSNGTTWENGDDYQYIVTQEDINAGFISISRPFNNLGLANVTHQPTTITFQVDMNGAAHYNGTAFPSIENVVIAGSVSPLQWPSSGWPDSDVETVHFLNDSGTDGDVTAGDGIWTVELTFPQYTALNFQYKYGANWGLSSNLGSNDNESNTGINHSITMETGLVSASVLDAWADMSPATLIDPIVGVDDEEIAPMEYSLAQNYPNPFNPTTNITFTMKEQGQVSLKIYDILGREVATLVNEVRNAGEHTINFNASSLASGMYIYTIKAGQFSATKKMMLLK